MEGESTTLLTDCRSSTGVLIMGVQKSVDINRNHLSPPGPAFIPLNFHINRCISPPNRAAPPEWSNPEEFLFALRPPRTPRHAPACVDSVREKKGGERGFRL